MIVIEDSRTGVVCQHGFHHLAGMDRGAVETASNQILRSDQPVPAVKMQHAEHSVLTSAQAHP
jgi:hypothetical protein